MFDFDYKDHLVLPTHGGMLQQAIAEGTHSASEWIDLSTGINPEPWPVPQVPTTTFHRLPEADQQLENAAKRYYFQHQNLTTTTEVLSIPGSQWFIQSFPGLIKQITKKPLKVLLPAYGFSEHEYWWRHHQHTITNYQDTDVQGILANPIEADVVVIINPNNPTTHFTSTDAIISSAKQNEKTLFIVDEAFIDSRSQKSLLNHPLPNNVIVLRSLGKFFGLAGLRIGFVFGPQSLIRWLKNQLGPWPIATPSQWIATQALQDSDWQTENKQHLMKTSRMLEELICNSGSTLQFSVNACDYFITLECDSKENAFILHKRFKDLAVLTRYFGGSPLLRIGLPKASDLLKLKEVLKSVLKDY